MSTTECAWVDPSNLEQARAWDGAEGTYWATNADRFDALLAPYQGPFLRAAAIGDIDQVLDVGCGTGQTSREAARAAAGGALRPKGRLTLLASQALARNEWLSEVFGALACGRDLPAPPPDAPGPFSFSEPDRIRALLGAAGFEQVVVEGLSALHQGSAAAATFRSIRRRQQTGPVHSREACVPSVAQTRPSRQIRPFFRLATVSLVD